MWPWKTILTVKFSTQKQCVFIYMLQTQTILWYLFAQKKRTLDNLSYTKIDALHGKSSCTVVENLKM